LGIVLGSGRLLGADADADGDVVDEDDGFVAAAAMPAAPTAAPMAAAAVTK
jgi:hypothetical protein